MIATILVRLLDLTLLQSVDALLLHLELFMVGCFFLGQALQRGRGNRQLRWSRHFCSVLWGNGLLTREGLLVLLFADVIKYRDV
jgi:hypothetical protein